MDVARPDQIDRITEQEQRVRPGFDPTSLAIVGRVQLLATRFAAYNAALTSERALGVGEYEVMVALLRVGPPYELSPSQIADWTLVSSGAVTKRVDRCIEQGWVTRRGGEGDRRGRVIGLTEEGRALVAATYDAALTKVEEVVGGLDGVERDRLLTLLEKWCRTLPA